MHRPNYGSTPYDWLYELPDHDLEALEYGLHELIRQRPSAFSVFKAHSMREAIECILFDRQQSRRRYA
ncbi:hypothetical protein [Chitinibacter sp. S2-10]|uniref:hypothetical protein n=1 Tax=Chitinibacter sp. S2-10 TaxID=3373597 RepID=UPI0039776048